MQIRRRADAQLTRAVKVEIELKDLASALQLLDLADAAPFEDVTQHDIDGAQAKPDGDAIQVDDAHVGGHGDADAGADPGHGFVAPTRVLVIFEIEGLDPLADPDGGCRGIDRLRV